VAGVGDHGCEYMTTGLVVVLGKCGRNFAAGMSGGIAYAFDEAADFSRKRCNLASVDLEPVCEEEDIQMLRALIAKHAALTGSEKAKRIIERWDDSLRKFVKVFPKEYRRVLEARTSQPTPAFVRVIPPSASVSGVQLG
jgi:glutamate synthase domain-containing protein 3